MRRVRRLHSHPAALTSDDDGIASGLAAGPPSSNHVRPADVWAPWVACVMAGQVVSAFAITTLPMRVGGGVPVAFVSATLGLVLVGLLQWAVLRCCLRRLEAWTWVVATVVGQLAGTAVVTAAVMGSLLSGAAEGIAERMGGVALRYSTSFVTGALFGGSVGAAQWLVLRRHLLAAAWWIVANMLAHAAAGAVSVIVGRGPSSTGILALALARLVSGFVVGSITGAALVWLLRQRQAAAVAARAGA